MRTYNAIDLADTIASRAEETLGAVELQKILYFTQGWSLAITGTPAHSSETQAWTRGPVVPDVWRAGDTRGGDSASDDAELHGLLTLVLAEYGRKSGIELTRLTHREGPWRDARGDIPETASSTEVIPLDKIRDHFRQSPTLAGFSQVEIMYLGLEAFDERSYKPVPKMPSVDDDIDDLDEWMTESANLFEIPR
ncbi:Panacea domain-containing protein [Corynebacterium bovis]|uniref:Putative phage-associated protein n=1 Tax=Corynebacterium bovis DSM 20582 = CIP 54.80 TaxID=927655 RepID=A0A8I0CP56_9CORY|nr:type II toxin-antitoxin system antitoxin SocA domain-containing protein [Corynebacterium bovis]MBB3116115.1 putative phage-associated protein [Corynebacterium bovis DSM 20582 = CIP 54.80]QQC47042.1 DUF4065 domain-containing protein [Corynebacterium bovis]RRO81295.1 DUF4065 domain-containing protein [Corynebacterium bovis]RRO88734.1 DUF4065 domain-containing protein [Corynebacterium bovis]RRO95943.1 DUF4065 domain-containing protein [Corynebacterium bovis]